MTDTKKTIFQSAKRFFSGTLVSRVTGLLRDVAMAFAFGTAPAAAALMVAFRFSHFFRRLLGEGALQTAFIPKFESYRQDNSSRALSFFVSLTCLLSALLVILAGVTMAGLSLGYYYGDLSDGNKEIIYLTFLMMPSLLFICLYGLNTGLLQCEKVYFVPSAAPAAFNMLWITAAMALSQFPANEAMPWIAGAIVIGCAAQWLVTLPSVITILKDAKFTLSFSTFTFFNSDIKQFLSPLFLGILGVAATQINNTLDPIFARYADSEGPAFLWYAIRLEMLPLALFGISVAGALLPPLSRAIQAQDLEKYKNFLGSAIHYTLLFMIPMSVALIIAGDACVNLLFGHGDFSIASTVATTYCLWAYALSLAPCALILIVAPGFYSMQDFKTPTLLSSLSVLINIFLNTFFVYTFSLGAASVALATSISGFANCFFLLWRLRRKIGGFLPKEIWISIAKTVGACCVGGVLAVKSDSFLYGNSSFMVLLNGEMPALPREFAGQLMRFFVQALAFGTPVVTFWLFELYLPNPLRLFTTEHTEKGTE